MLGKQIRYNKKAILKLRSLFFSSNLNSRIKCLIVHGSCIYQEIIDDRYTDIDLELILTSSSPRDYLILKSILKKSPIKVECQLRYLDEITLKDNVIKLSSYKLFMYFAYANGVCLLGENIYQKLINDLTDLEIKQSLLISIQIAFKDIRKIYLSKINNVYMINKNIKLVFLDILMYEGTLDYKKLGKAIFFREGDDGYSSLILKLYRRYLNKKDRIIIKKFSESYKLCELDLRIFPVVEKIMYIFEKRVKK